LAWIGRGAWAVADQGFFALSAFLINIMLARELAPAEFGAYSVAFTIYLLVGVPYSAMCLEPMLVFGAGRFKDRLGPYLSWVFTLQGALTVGMGVLCAAAAGVAALLKEREMALALAGLTLSMPSMLFLWMARKACYIEMRPQPAAVAGAGNLVVTIGALWLLGHLGWLSTFAAFVTMGVIGLAASVALTWWLRVRPPQRGAAVSAREVMAEHWRYGRWAVATGTLHWIPGNLYSLTLPLWAGLEGSAALRSLMNLFMPIAQANSALGILLLAVYVRHKASGRLARTVRLSALGFLAATVAYWLLLGLFHHPVMVWLYKGKYVEYGHLLWIFGLVPVVTSLCTVYGGVLRASERPDLVFWGQLAGTAVTVTLGTVLTWRMGLPGAIIGMALSFAVAAATLWHMTRRPLPAAGGAAGKERADAEGG
jgi:O-antigen/teichoic acid export membrane protein